MWDLEDTNPPSVYPRLQIPSDNIIKYYIDLSKTPFGMLHSHLIACIDEALGKWIHVFNIGGRPLSRQRNDSDPSQANLIFKWDYLADPNEAGHTSAGGTQGFSPFNEKTGPFTITFDFARSWQAVGTPLIWQYDLRSVTAHEVGHALGLDHCTMTNSVMQPKLDIATRWVADGQGLQIYDTTQLWLRYMDLFGPLTAGK